MPTIIFDTETTGLVKEKLSSTHEKQPMPVQLGLKLDGDDRLERAALNFMIQPEGWKVDPKAAAVTGITTEIADQYGANLLSGIEMFLDLMQIADTVVAHNLPFDFTVMQRACFVYAKNTGTEYYDPFEGKKLICTMRAATPICKLLPKRYGDYKWPKLTEAMKFFFNEELEGAHDALVDVRATAKLHYHLLDTGVYLDERTIT